MDHKNFDAIVIGSGVGGICSAALLAHSGLKTLVVEKLPFLGGRFSSRVCKGYTCTTGAIAVQLDGVLKNICDRVGADIDIRPAAKTATWIDGRFYEMPSKGALRFLLSRVAEDEAEVRRVMLAVKQALQVRDPHIGGSFRNWLEQFTQNKKILDLFNATITSLLTVNIDECPAAEYFQMLRAVSPLRFGWAPGGNVQIVEALAGVVRRHGGIIRPHTSVERIAVQNGVAQGVIIRTEGRKVRVNAEIVVSNAGPAKTIELIGLDRLDTAYVDHINATVKPTALIWIQFASDEPLNDYSAVTVSGARRVNMIDTPTIECPELAPTGRHLTISGGAPASNIGPIDWDREIKLNFKDLRDVLPGFDTRAEVLMVSRFRKDWPAYRTMPGRQLSFETPIANLYNAGDATGPSGWVGTIGAAKSACLIADHVTGLGI